MSEKMAKAITENDVAEQMDCIDCQGVRATRGSFRGELEHAKGIGDVIHSDLCGELHKGKHKYPVSSPSPLAESQDQRGWPS
jgi:hypothetical protein